MISELEIVDNARWLAARGFNIPAPAIKGSDERQTQGRTFRALKTAHIAGNERTRQIDGRSYTHSKVIATF